MSMTDLARSNSLTDLAARIPISDIRIGLETSIEELGLLHPVVIRPDGTLIAGERRLAACKLQAWTLHG